MEEPKLIFNLKLIFVAFSLVALMVKSTCSVTPKQIRNSVTPSRTIHYRYATQFGNETETSYIFKLGRYNVSLISSTFLTNNSKNMGTFFDRNYFGVYFQPVITNLVKSNISDIVELLKIVNSRFSNVITKVKNVANNPSNNIPRAAAHINKYLTVINRSSGGRFKNMPLQPTKVSIVFNYSTEKIYSSADEEFDKARKLANEANKIHPNTVSFIIANVWTIQLIDFVEISIRLGEMSEKLKQDALRRKVSRHRFGIMLSGEFCFKEQNFDSIVSFILPFVDLLLLSFDTTPQLAKESTRVIQNFEVCKTKIYLRDMQVQVGLFTGWYDSETTLKKGPDNLVRFWNQMNDYSRETNTLVYMLEAFDDPNDKLKSGWWTLEDKKGNTSLTNLVLREKHISLAVIAEEETATSRPNIFSVTKLKKQSENISSASDYAIAITVLFIGLVAVIWITNYRRERTKRKSLLPPNEIAEFFQGSSACIDGVTKFKTYGAVSNAHRITRCLAYDRKLEIAPNDITIDESWILGSGLFGTVYFGRITINAVSMKVAVKRANTKGDGISCVKNLLSEIKVLSYVGKHENIVTLLGAHTKDIEKGQVCAFLELCCLGCLKVYLEKISTTGSGTRDSEYLHLHEIPIHEDISALLARWSVDIVQGMDFLSSKGVVHADLATRNVLLDINKVAKICDFGLSQTPAQEDYATIQREKLPWRWMAPEALRLSEFTEKTDVWSFGVTLWEIYTLGKLPYAGVPWNSEFLVNLENGFRLEEPKHDFVNGTQLYKVMLQCWDRDSDKRPNFAQLKTQLITFL